MKLFYHIILPVMAILFTGHSADAQLSSHQSGFYSVDSLFFTVTQVAPPGGKVEISVNCFTNANCFHEYKTGVWLYNRNNTPNTWEDQQFSRAPTGASDTLAYRGSLDKVNVIRVRIKQANGSILSDSAYFIGILGKGAAYPYTLPVVHLLVDSMEAFGPQGFYGPGEGIRNQYVQVWNYELDQSPLYSSYVPRSRVEKTCVMQIIGADQHPALYQGCGIQTTGLQSRSLPNKSLQVVARNEYSHSNIFKTALLDKNISSYSSIKFRSGGAGQSKGFGAHEIGERIINGLNLGEVPVTPVITFLNGSYWSLSFAQADIEEYSPSNVKSPEEISLFKPLYFKRTAKFIGNLRNMQIDTSKIVWTTIPGSGEAVGTALLLHGNKKLFNEVSKHMVSWIESKGTPPSFTEINDVIDLDSWLTYIAVVDFGRIENSIDHHIFMGTAPGKKMFLLMDEVKDFAQQDPKGNHWKEHISGSDTSSADEEEKTVESALIRRVLLKNKTCIEKLCLRYQDLLNTQFKSDKTLPVVEKLSAELLPEYGKYWRSWKPNSGVDSTGEVALMGSIKSFLAERPDIAWQQLADQWMPAANLHLPDRKTVSVVLDSVPEGTVKIHLNSLTHTKSWTGLYYPDPSLEVAVESQNVPSGYTVVIKEFVTMPASFKIPAQSNITLTPVLRPAKKGGN